MTRPAPSKPYVSPATWAADLLARAAAGEAVSPKTLQAAKRIHALGHIVKQDLDALEAPLHVYRWCAWAPRSGGITLIRRRVDLVQHLRNAFVRNKDGWFRERELTAAFAAWEQAREEARCRGAFYPDAKAVPAERYMEAISALYAAPAPAPAPEVPVAMRTLAKLLAEQLNRPR